MHENHCLTVCWGAGGDVGAVLPPSRRVAPEAAAVAVWISAVIGHFSQGQIRIIIWIFVAGMPYPCYTRIRPHRLVSTDIALR